MRPLIERLERYFEFQTLGTNWRTEILAGVTTFALNVWICWRLFTSEYIDQMGSIEGTHIALGRWIAGNWWDLSWFPLWYGGIPWHNTYSPLHPVLVAGVSSLTGISPALAYHALTALFYALGPVTLFWLALRLTRSTAPAFLAGLVYSLVSPSSFLVPAIRYDAGGVWHARRLQALVQYGEGPHIAAMALLPLAILLLDVAREKRRVFWWVLSGLSLAGVVLTNWLGGAALLFAVAAWLLADLDREWWRRWVRVLGTGLFAYAVASPWIPPSAVLHIRAQERYVSGTAAPERWLYASAALLAAAGLLWFFRKCEAPRHLRFALLFLLPMAVVPLVSYHAGVDLLPQASRYHLEMEMGCAIVVAGMAKLALDRMPPRWRLVCLTAVLLLCVHPLTQYRHHARGMIGPIDAKKTIEFREAQWFKAHVADGRVFAPGSVSFFLNVFTDVPQYGGGFDQGVVNPVYPAVHYQVLTGENAGAEEGEIAVEWLKTFGVDFAGVSGPRSTEYYKPVRNFRKFDGLLREVWRAGDDVIYEVPRRNRSLAHVIRREDLPSRPPTSGLDTEPAKRYVAALEDPALPAARFQWKSHHEASVAAQLRTEQLVSVQISYHPGWSASVNGRPCRAYGDALGQLVIEPACEGTCRIGLRFDPGLELRLLRWLSLAVLLGGVAWTLADRRK